MKTSTIVWTLAVLIILFGVGAYWYSVAPANAPVTTQNEVPGIGNSNLPPGDLAPVPSTPIASSSSAGAAASSSFKH